MGLSEPRTWVLYYILTQNLISILSCKPYTTGNVPISDKQNMLVNSKNLSVIGIYRRIGGGKKIHRYISPTDFF